MPLLEIIKGEQTSEETLYRALDLAKQIKKTPIVVNDSRGFFTSRVIGTFINEGIAMLLEGVPAPTIEQASSQAGYPAPVLQLSDELNLKLMRKIRIAAKEAADAASHGLGRAPVRAGHRPHARRVRPPRPARGPRLLRVRRRRAQRPVEGAAGRRSRPWRDPSTLALEDLEERMLFIESIESVKCLEEGVIESVADANIGSILGIGFPGWTGGVLQYINGYEHPGEPRRPSVVRRSRARARRALRRALRAARLARREGRARRELRRYGGARSDVRLTARQDMGEEEFDVRIHAER